MSGSVSPPPSPSKPHKNLSQLMPKSSSVANVSESRSGDTQASSAELAIDVKGLTKSFNGKQVVRNVSLQVRTGQIYGFLGPNGSGKTTTLRMICGLLTPDGGRGTCLGYDILTQRDEIKRRVGYMTQRFSLYQDLS